MYTYLITREREGQDEWNTYDSDHPIQKGKAVQVDGLTWYIDDELRRPEKLGRFTEHIPDDCKKAYNELKRLKVFNLCAWDYEETFTDVWWLVLHEVDMYEEGEFCREASHSIYEPEPEAMNLRQAQAADRWLVRWWPLAKKYSMPEYNSAYHDRYIGWFGEDGIAPYTGQLI